MSERFGFLRLLAKLYAICAWLGVAGGVIALLVVDITDKGVALEYVRGIGFVGALCIVVASALHFLVFTGLSQMFRLLLELDEMLGKTSQRVADLALVLNEIKTAQSTTAERVRMVGEIVYKEVKKDE